MQFKKIYTIALASFFVVFGLGFVTAQSGSLEDSAQQVELSSEEQIEGAENILEQGQTICERVDSMINSARGRGDIVLIDCLTPLNAQCSANIDSTEERIRYLRDAVTNRDQVML